MEVTQEGWVVVTVDDDEVERAKARTVEGDRQASGTGLTNVATVEQRATGHVFERVFEWWLESQDVEFTHDGGVNLEPDFIVNGVTVAARRTAASSRFRLDHLCYAFAAHAERATAASEWFFGGHLIGTNTYYLLGGQKLGRFLAASERYEEGATVCRGFVAHHPLYATTIDHLAPPGRWLQRVLR